MSPTYFRPMNALLYPPGFTLIAFRFRLPSRPNKSLQPTPTAVMPPAAQEIMPAVGVAEH
jgi:hypothetical protein